MEASTLQTELFALQESLTNNTHAREKLKRQARLPFPLTEKGTGSRHLMDGCSQPSAKRGTT
ncbi:MAG: hypothetical protein LBJ47_09865 [Tannerella sp.]|jgi:hypothetical protein|nr:hypothetical protein [Tannerella sp.]